MLKLKRKFGNLTKKIKTNYFPKFKSSQRSGDSKHALAEAADIKCDEVTPFHLYSLIDDLIGKGEILQGGLGKYSTFTHYDIRKTKARW